MEQAEAGALVIGLLRSKLSKQDSLRVLKALQVALEAAIRGDLKE